jgi:hypothetical protein
MMEDTKTEEINYFNNYDINNYDNEVVTKIKDKLKKD